MLLFYREQNCDYLCVEANSQFHCKRRGGDTFEGRAAEIPNRPESVRDTKILKTYLATQCKSVNSKDVPQEWRDALLTQFIPAAPAAPFGKQQVFEYLRDHILLRQSFGKLELLLEGVVIASCEVLSEK